MPTVLRFRRGDTTASNAFTGAEGELFVDTSKDTVVVHDGVTAGGKPLATEASLNNAVASVSMTLTNQLNAKADTSALTSGLAGKQDTLVSGTNIKTVNGTSILGSGNIVISGGSGGSADLTQVASDITPTFDSVYDLGSSTNRFYDAYLGNKLDINTATLLGSMTGSEGSTSTSTATTTILSTDVGSFGMTTLGAEGAQIVGVPDGTVCIYTSGSPNVASLLSIPVGTVIDVYNDSNVLVATVTTIGAAVPRYWDNAGMLIPTNAPSPTFLGMMGGTKIEYSSTVTTVVPDTREWTLASNATLVAPSVAVDTSLIGGLFTEGTTVTPEHILGTYTDTKGTLTVDGSLKVNNEVRSRNIVLQQEAQTIATVVSKSSTLTVANVNIVTDQDWSPLGTYSMYSNFSSLVFSGDITLSSKGSYFTVGSKLTLRWNSYFWEYTINSVEYMYGQTIVYHTPGATNAPQSSYDFTMGGMQSFGQAGYGSYQASIDIEATVNVNELELDNGAIALTSNDKILVNSQIATTPVTVTKTINQAYSSIGWASAGNLAPGVIGFNYYSSLANLDALPELIKTTIEIFSNGNTVTMVYPGYGTSVYTVSNAGLQYGMYGGNNSAWGFQLTFVSGYDFVNMSGFGDSIQSGPYNQMNVSATVISSINYTTAHIAQFAASTVSNNKYLSSTNWDWLNVGDKLSYIPSTTSITFKKDDGTSVKAITYDNNTGAMSYDGLVQVLTKNSVGDIYSVDAGNFTASTDSNRQSIIIGYNATASTSGGYASSVAIGKSATANSGGVAIYGNASGTEAITIGGVADGYRTVAIGKDSAAYNNYSSALGSNAIVDSSGATAIGSNLRVSVPYATARNSIGQINRSNCTFETHVWNQYATITGNSSYYPMFGSGSTSAVNSIDAVSVLGWYNNTIALATSTILIKDTSTQTRWKVIKLEYIVNSTSAYTFAISNITNTTVGSGSDSAFASAFSAGVEINSNQYIAAKIINGTSTSYNVGVDIKTTYQVMQTT